MEKAAGDCAGPRTMHGDLSSNSGAASLGPVEGAKRSIQVEAGALTDLVSLDLLSKASLIKIDIEGFEPAIFRQLVALLPILSKRLTIVAEVTPHAFDSEGFPLAHVINTFRLAGFSAFSVFNDYGISDDWWHFVADRPPQISPLTAISTERFDLVLTRTDAA